MAVVKVKFRPSAVAGKEGAIYFQIIHKGLVRQITTRFRLFSGEWNARTGRIVVADEGRRDCLRAVQTNINRSVYRLRSVIRGLDDSMADYTADDVVSAYLKRNRELSFYGFMDKIIAQKQLMGRDRTSETYLAALRSVMQFRRNRDFLLDEIDTDMLLMYEGFLRTKGLTKNSRSFYMRIVRAVYNLAVGEKLVTQSYPFRSVYTGIDKTVKRFIPLDAVKRIKNLKLSSRPALDFARDMFLFSFYTRGMSFVDMAYLKKECLQNGMLVYRRRKTGQLLFIRWEECMQKVIDKYQAADAVTPYILPILGHGGEGDRKCYKNALYRVNRNLKSVARMACVDVPLTMYCARHSWACIARNKRIPVSVISEGMGHNSEMTTRIYLASMDKTVIDEANKRILNDL